MKNLKIVVAILCLAIIGYQYYTIKSLNSSLEKREDMFEKQEHLLLYFKDRYQFVMINEAIRLQVNQDYCQAYDKLQRANSILPLKENSTDFLNEMKKKCENH